MWKHWETSPIKTEVLGCIGGQVKHKFIQGSREVPSSCLGQGDLPVGQETCHVHLPDRQRPRKVICKSSHKKGNKSKHAIALGKWNLRVICLKDKLKFNCFFFWTLLISLRMIKNKSRWLDCRSDVVTLISPSSGHFINLPWPLIYMNFSQHYIDMSVREKLTEV